MVYRSFRFYLFSNSSSILAVLHAGNEFTSKIHRQHFIDGLSKDEYIISKLFSILIITLVCTLYTAFLCFVVGILNNSSSMSQEEINSALDMIFGSTPPILWLFGYFIYTFSILSFALLITFIFRKTGISIFVFISYFLIIEWILHWLLRGRLGIETLAEYLPIWSISNNIFPNMTEVGIEAEAAYQSQHRGINDRYAENILSFDWSDTLRGNYLYRNLLLINSMDILKKRFIVILFLKRYLFNNYLSLYYAIIIDIK